MCDSEDLVLIRDTQVRRRKVASSQKYLFYYPLFKVDGYSKKTV